MPAQSDLSVESQDDVMHDINLALGSSHLARAGVSLSELERKAEEHPRLLSALEHLVNYMRHFEIEDPEWPIESLREAEELIEQVHAS
ncbi:hypothetical protein [Luteolibacter sp. LG18]|uniref:hypothetical protein n=1 Tax=Luteolibacter sp. LG18 TaxID=2819286 RepID=UPI002B2DDA7A|nr:hypothetical protein llg_07360 [Luteolibacter sp. LG18]BCU79635.1 hypothetical protein llg_43500 [Luteolibacter sp. LG18]